MPLDCSLKILLIYLEWRINSIVIQNKCSEECVCIISTSVNRECPIYLPVNLPHSFFKGRWHLVVNLLIAKSWLKLPVHGRTIADGKLLPLRKLSTFLLALDVTPHGNLICAGPVHFIRFIVIFVGVLFLCVCGKKLQPKTCLLCQTDCFTISHSYVNK